MISAADLARRLARDAEAVCRHYLSNGRRSGHYWIIGDVMNTPGRSLYVRLTGPDSGPGAAGKWTDAASPSEHGDLLDLIRLNRNLYGVGAAMGEARRFLALPCPPIPSPTNLGHMPPAATGSSETARRLFHAGRPVPGTPAEAYLRARGITARLDWPALRYHPSVYYRAAKPAPAKAGDAPLEVWPALLAAVTDLEGNITGIQRTWLDPRRSTKAPLTDPRRALGHLLGNGVRFGAATDVLAVGEGVETMLALKSVLPLLPVVAGLSANHLAALNLPPAPGSRPGQALRRLYVARDNDAAGLRAAERLRERGIAVGIEIRELVPVYGDFNLDLCRLGLEGMRARLANQPVPSDCARFLPDTRRSDPRR
ncbi:MAG: toprim domain-containing protein [Stellaceae bacterium]